MSCIKHLLWSTSPLCHLFSDPWPLVSPQMPPLQPVWRGLCSFSLCRSASWEHIPMIRGHAWCSAPHVSCCCKGIRYHVTKKSWEENSPCGEPLVKGRQWLVDQFFSLSPPGGTSLRGSSSYGLSQDSPARSSN